MARFFQYRLKTPAMKNGKDEMLEMIYTALGKSLGAFLQKGSTIFALSIAVGGLTYACVWLYFSMESRENRFTQKLENVQIEWSKALNECNREREQLAIKVAVLDRIVSNLEDQIDGNVKQKKRSH